MDYKKCCLYTEEVCGPYRRSKPHVDGLFSVTDLGFDTLKHLENLNLKKLHESNDGWNERELIENCLDKTLKDEDKICAYHRFVNGIGWRPSRRCQHPHHLENQKKSPATRPIPLKTAIAISNRYNCYLPIGSLMCFNHLKDEQKFMASTSEEQESQICEAIVSQSTPAPARDPDYEPGEVIIPENVLDSSTETAQAFADCLDDSPVRFQLKRKLVADISGSTKSYLKQKYAKAKKMLAQKFAEVVAPGQSQECLTSVLEPSEEEEETTAIPDDIKRFVKIYQDSDELSRTVIISLLDHEKYSKEFIMNSFVCSRYKVDVDTQIDAGLVIPTKKGFKRIRLNLNKCEHFLDFVFTSGLLQDVTYGVTRVKFDSGKQEKVAHAVLTTKFSHTISFYLESCKANQYKPLSESTLWRILRAINPSQRKSLAGLDDVTASSMNGFDTLSRCSGERYTCSLGMSKKVLEDKVSVTLFYSLCPLTFDFLSII